MLCLTYLAGIARTKIDQQLRFVRRIGVPRCTWLAGEGIEKTC